jgi:hypothetical protein
MRILGPGKDPKDYLCTARTGEKAGQKERGEVGLTEKGMSSLHDAFLFLRSNRLVLCHKGMRMPCQ